VSDRLPEGWCSAVAFADLAAALRDDGFRVGVDQLCAAQDLLILLASRGDLIESAEELASWLAPIFATSLEEQERIPDIIRAWAGRIEREGQPVPGGGLRTPAREVKDAAWRQLTRRYRIGPPIAALGFAVLSVVAAAYLGRSPRAQLRVHVEGTVVVAGSGAPIEAATIILPSRTVNTDAGGRFEVSVELSEGSTISATVTRRGFEPSHFEIAASAGPRRTVRVALSPIDDDPLIESSPTASVSVPPDSFDLLIERWNLWAASLRSSRDESGALARFWQRHEAWIRWALAGAAFAALIVLVAWRQQRSRVILARGERRSVEDLARVSIAGKDDVLAEVFPRSELGRVARLAREPRPNGVPVLDESSTIDATIRRGGLFAPVYTEREAPEEFVALIDRSSFQDFETLRARELIGLLVERGARVETWVFDGDARLCRPVSPRSRPEIHPGDVEHDSAIGGRALSLAEIVARYANATGLLFIDPAALFDRFHGRPRSWLATLHALKRRWVCSPPGSGDPSEDPWSRRLRDAGFETTSATLDGIERVLRSAFAGTLQGQEERLGRASRYPEDLRIHESRWISELRPSEDELDALVLDLWRWLGRDGMRWLAACAVYPEFHWSLTLYLGRRLRAADGTPLANDEMLRRLVRLPWFHHGRMPDWLRERLVDTIDSGTELTVRDALRELILPECRAALAGGKLAIASAPSIARRLITDILSRAAGRGPHLDRVFLRIVVGRPSRLALALPRFALRALFPHGEPSFGLRAATWVAIAWIFALGAWALPAAPEPRLVAREPVPRFQGVDGKEFDVESVREHFGGIDPRDGLELARSERPWRDYASDVEARRLDAFEARLEGDEAGAATYLEWLKRESGDRGILDFARGSLLFVQPWGGGEREHVFLGRVRPRSGPPPIDPETKQVKSGTDGGNRETIIDPPIDPPPETKPPPDFSGFRFIETNQFGYLEYDHADTGIRFVHLPGGRFQMGAPGSELESKVDERPVREVELSPFLIGKYEVSQSEWMRVVQATKGGLKAESSIHKGDDLPVDEVSWDDCKAFCRATGLSLPTEAQWEYACRAGTTTPFFFGATIGTDQVNYDGGFPYGGAPKGERRRKTVPVKYFTANGFGVHQMHGNVWEWCEDGYGPYSAGQTPDPVGSSRGTGRVLRGGSWLEPASRTRSAARLEGSKDWDDVWRGFLGFRLAASPAPGSREKSSE
jgi:formylglycine-generating enzyme required for sulfatase activity